MVRKWVSDAAVDADKLILVSESGCIQLNHFDPVHLFDHLVELLEAGGVESKGWSRALSHLSDVAVDFLLPASLSNQFNVAACGLENTPNCEESLDVVCVDQLFATKYVDEIECLR